jgi:hypothetical protein
LQSAERTAGVSSGLLSRCTSINAERFHRKNDEMVQGGWLVLFQLIGPKITKMIQWVHRGASLAISISKIAIDATTPLGMARVVGIR